ncbi:uncharacterized protein PAC_19472 [Phialocephala subalpina]|uniref:Heterokaryon incompatibility domain-containing protein n=1 Tax=Phialocephala subalpina TaxID=576137 RepID=A0A1L7XWX7_9HELO|nr:uncharacterized protein PAC_19472 [Phialocephala subalpina]
MNPQVKSITNIWSYKGRDAQIDSELCDTCTAIPFDKLPNEEDPAYPHKQGLSDLEESSKVCKLCKLILSAIQDAQGDFDLESYDIADTIRPKMNDYDKIYSSDLSASKKFGVHQVVFKVPETKLGPTGPQDLSSELVKRMKVQKDPSNRIWLYGNWWTLIGVNQCPPQLIGFGARLTLNPRLRISNVNGERRSILYRGSDIRVFMESNGMLLYKLPARKVESDRKGDRIFNELQSWVVNCDNSHECAQLHPMLPTRVLDLKDVQNNGEVHLFETHKMKGKYIALSHCWGPPISHPLKTSRATLKSHKEGISLSRLPQTFRDAIAITTRLNIRYLWIDSLCILQGDKDDWERESSRMCDVYENSYLTIAASISTGSDCGFLSPRRSSTYISPDSLSTGLNEQRNQNCRVQYRPSGSQQSTLYFTKEWMPTSFKDNPRFYQLGSFGALVDPLDKEPLNKRGWTLQERYLPPRIVHYGKDQLFFECKGGAIAEDGSRFESLFSKESLLHYRNKTSSYWSNSLYTPDGPKSFPDDIQLLSRRTTGWPFAVEVFSRRELSVGSDKLPALSGIARYLARESGDIYLAGIWKQHVFQDLLWRVSPYDDDTTAWINKDYIQKSERVRSCKRPSTVTFPSDYRAPSWSWAALDGPVKFERLRRIPQRPILCDYLIKPDGIDIFGSIEYGQLRIKAPLFQAERAQSCSAIPGRIALYARTGNKVYQGNAVFDHKPQSLCFALFLDSEYALLLKASIKEPGKFERIGLASFLTSDIGTSGTLMEGTNVIEYLENDTGILADVPDDCPIVIIV